MILKFCIKLEWLLTMQLESEWVRRRMKVVQEWRPIRTKMNIKPISHYNLLAI